MTLKEAQERLGVSRQRVYMLRKSGKIQLNEESIQNYLNTKRVGRPIIDTKEALEIDYDIIDKEVAKAIELSK